MTKSIIVGIDPGTTVGIAILDTKGEIIDLYSKREAKKSDIIKHILKFGRPIIIASDVNPLPKTIDKLASSLGSKTYLPEVSLSNTEKVKIIREYLDVIKNSHQKDALAAGLKAFKNYHELFLKVEEVLVKIRREELSDEVVERLLEKGDESIVDSVREILKRSKK